MSRSPNAIPRHVHPLAWWGWAIALAVAVSQTTNPLVLLLALAVAWLVVDARQGTGPWARSFRLYLLLGVFIVAARGILHVVVGLKFGDIVVLALPAVTMPSWAAGIELFGTVRLEGLLGALVEGLRLAVMIACIGAANSLAEPKRLLRSLPAALGEIGTAAVVTVSVAPQLAASVQRVVRARELRGDTARGLRAVPRVALPVLEDTLVRSLMLAAAMDSRGYGRRLSAPPGLRLASGFLGLGGLVAVCASVYGLLSEEAPRWMGWPLLVIGSVGCVAAIVVGGRTSTRTTYRPDPWGRPEWVTVLSGLAAAAGMFASVAHEPLTLTLPLAPLAVPGLPVFATLGLIVALTPTVATPPVPRPAPRVSTRERVSLAIKEIR